MDNCRLTIGAVDANNRPWAQKGTDLNSLKYKTIRGKRKGELHMSCGECLSVALVSRTIEDLRSLNVHVAWLEASTISTPRPTFGAMVRTWGGVMLAGPWIAFVVDKEWRVSPLDRVHSENKAAQDAILYQNPQLYGKPFPDAAADLARMNCDLARMTKAAADLQLLCRAQSLRQSDPKQAAQIVCDIDLSLLPEDMRLIACRILSGSLSTMATTPAYRKVSVF